MCSVGSVDHTWYFSLQFPKRMLNESELSDLKVSESDAYLEGMKRYSEFLSLHNKLLRSPSYARHVKGNRISSCSLALAFPFSATYCMLHVHAFLCEFTHICCLSPILYANTKQVWSCLIEGESPALSPSFHLPVLILIQHFYSRESKALRSIFRYIGTSTIRMIRAHTIIIHIRVTL